MKNKICPYCSRKLTFIELLFLDEYKPTVCKNCGQNLKNTRANSIVSIVLPTVLFTVALYIFDLNFVYAFSLLLLLPVLRVTLAEPSRYQLTTNVQTCEQCGRADVRFKNSFAKICEGCRIPENNLR